MKTIYIVVVSLMAAILISCNGRTKKNPEHTMDQGTMVLTNTVKDKDEDFVKEAANGGMMEIELGQYARQNAQSQRVKNFGAMMVKDHTKANDDLKSIAADKKFNLSDSTGQKQANDISSSLQKKSGADFDKDYMKEMVDDHEKVIDKFKNEVENGQDPDLKTFAINTLPVLQIHQDSAKNILKSLK